MRTGELPFVEQLAREVVPVVVPRNGVEAVHGRGGCSQDTIDPRAATQHLIDLRCVASSTCARWGQRGAAVALMPVPGRQALRGARRWLLASSLAALAGVSVAQPLKFLGRFGTEQQIAAPE